VFEAEKLADDANEMKPIQAMSGRYLLTAPGYESRPCLDSIDSIGENESFAVFSPFALADGQDRDPLFGD
jgi:hypothetical protein